MLATWVWPTTHQMKRISFKFHFNLKLHGNEASSSVSLQMCISTHHSQIESEAGRVKLLACRLVTKPFHFKLPCNHFIRFKTCLHQTPRMLPNRSWIYEVMNLWGREFMTATDHELSWYITTVEKWGETIYYIVFADTHTHTHIHTLKHPHTHPHTYTHTHTHTRTYTNTSSENSAIG